MLLTLSPRLFIGLLGAAAILAGLIALATGVNALDATSPFGSQVSCGTAVMPNHTFAATACEQALGTRRAWGWPLLVGGIVAAAGALLVQTRRPEPAPQADET